MTLVVAVVSEEVAFVATDTRCILHGPASIPWFGMAFPSGFSGSEDGSVLELPVGERLVVDQPWPHLPKAILSSDGRDLFSFAGSRRGEEPYLGLSVYQPQVSRVGTGPLTYSPTIETDASGADLDERIAKHFSDMTRFDVAGTAPAMEFMPSSGLHVYRSGSYMIAAEFHAHPFCFCRKLVRSLPEEARWVAIGSGEPYFKEFMKREAPAKRWRELGKELAKVPLDDLVDFWRQGFGYASEQVREKDINTTLSIWELRREKGLFQHRGLWSAETQL